MLFSFVDYGVYARENHSKTVPDSAVGGDFYMLYAVPTSTLSGDVGCAYRGDCAQDYAVSPGRCKVGPDCGRRTLKG
jgi:hypothetical protein